jgi:hypothetical protein
MSKHPTSVFNSVIRLLITLSFAAVPLAAQDLSHRPVSPDDFDALHQLIKPQEGEFAWYDEIPWMTRLQPAREKAAAEGKPLLIWTSADGQPCGAG